MFDQNELGNVNARSDSKTSGTSTILHAEAYKNARLIILSDSAGLVFSEPILSGIIPELHDETDALVSKQKTR